MSASAARTPGPWVYHSGAVYAAAPVDGNGWASKRLLLADRGVDTDTMPCERDANVRLAALAPELLAMVIRLRDDVAAEYTTSRNVREADALIEKAGAA